MSGFGGAGAFSDGKYNITNDFGGTLHEYIGKEEAIRLMEYVDSINVSHGGAGTKLYSTANSSFKKLCRQNDLILLDASVRHLGYALEHKNVGPQNFLGIGGMKIFRDLIYQMQGMMRADHKFFKAQGQYDFPQKNKGQILFMYLVGAMLGNKKLKAKMGGKMNEGMLMPYKKVLDDLDKK